MYQDMRRLLKLAPNESPSYEPDCLTPVCPVAAPPVVERKFIYSVCSETPYVIPAATKNCHSVHRVVES